MAPPSNVWSEDFVLPRRDTAGLREQVESLVDQLGEPYSIQARSRRTSWGADSGEVVAVVLFVSGAITQAFLDQAVGDLFARLRAQVTGQDRDRRPLTHAEAVERAKWVVLQRYSVLAADKVERSEDDFEVVGVTEDRETGRWTVTVRAPSGWTFEVTMSAHDGLFRIDRLDAAKQPD